MNLFSKFPFVLLLIGFILVASCEKENEQLTKPDKANGAYLDLQKFKIGIHDGILEFKSLEDFTKTAEILVNNGSQFRADWEKSKGFVSLRSVIDSIIDEIEMITSEEEIRNKVAESKDLIQFKNGLVQSRFSRSFSTVLNRDGLVKIDGMLIFLDKEIEIVSVKGDKDVLKRGLITKKEDRSAGLMVVHLPDFDETALRGECRTVILEENEANNKRIRLRCDASLGGSPILYYGVPTGNWQFAPSITCYLEHKKKMLIGGYNRSATTLSWNLNFTAEFYFSYTRVNGGTSTSFWTIPYNHVETNVDDLLEFNRSGSSSTFLIEGSGVSADGCFRDVNVSGSAPSSGLSVSIMY
jgi:hypothetical protein